MSGHDYEGVRRQSYAHLFK